MSQLEVSLLYQSWGLRLVNQLIESNKSSSSSSFSSLSWSFPHPHPHPPHSPHHFHHPHPFPHPPHSPHYLYHPHPHQESVLLWVTFATPRPAFVHPMTQVLHAMIFWVACHFRADDSPQLYLGQCICRPSTGATSRAALPEAGLSAILRSR